MQAAEHPTAVRILGPPPADKRAAVDTRNHVADHIRLHRYLVFPCPRSLDFGKSRTGRDADLMCGIAAINGESVTNPLGQLSRLY